MSVLINNMKMPKSCIDCPMINNEDWCVLQKIPINDNDIPSTWEELKKGCPLEERPKGHWIPQNHNKTNGMVSTLVYYYPKCSVCGHCANYTNFCPNCGADMRGEDE